MISLVDLLNFSIAAAGLVVTVLGVILSFRIHYFDRKERHFFISFFLVMFAYVSTDLLTQVFFLSPGSKAAIFSRTSMFLESPHSNFDSHFKHRTNHLCRLL